MNTTTPNAETEKAHPFGALMDTINDFTAAELTEVLNAAIVVKTRREA